MGKEISPKLLTELLDELIDDPGLSVALLLTVANLITFQQGVAEKMSAEHDKEIEALQKQNRYLTAQVVELQAEVKARDAKLVTYEYRVDRLSESIRGLHAEIAAKDARIAELTGGAA